jgi:hypothetical protein
MSPTARKLLVGLAIAGATAGLGMGLAAAQTDLPSTTTPPTTQAPPDQPQRDRDCPWKDGRWGGKGGGAADETRLMV